MKLWQHRSWLIFEALLLTIIISGCARKFDPLLSRAVKSYSAQNYVETIDALSLALRNWRESDGTEKKAQATELLGKAYKEIGKFDKAMDHFSDAIEMSSNTYDSAYTLGILNLAASKPNEAIRAFKTALKMKKDDPLALVGLGNSYFSLNDFVQAQVAYNRVIETSPGVSTALESLAIINKRNKEKRAVRRAIQNFRRR